MTLGQALFPVTTWVVAMDDIDFSINDYDQKMNSSPVLSHSSGNRYTSLVLSNQKNTLVGSNNGILLWLRLSHGLSLYGISAL
jgi:hypothetical protein